MKEMKVAPWIPLLVLLFTIACDHKKETSLSEIDIEEVPSKTEIKYAKRFDIFYGKGYKLISLDRPWQGSNKPVTYLLKDSALYGTQKIKADVELNVPIKKLICTSTTQVALLESIGVTDALIGFPNTKYLYSSKYRSRLADGTLLDVGMEASLNIEKVLSLQSDLVMGFSSGSESAQLAKLRELGVRVVMNADYLETSLLGRAEWIKFAAAFFNKEQEANEYFDQLVVVYDSLKNIVTPSHQPTVFGGVMYGSTWYLPGGKNYGAELIEAAGGQYLWSENKEAGWLNLDFEAVYARAAMAEVWIGAADFQSLDELVLADERYDDFQAFKEGRVYAAVNRKLESGANDYFESAGVRPDLLLADHIKILHPELLPSHDLYYYRKLE